MKDEKKLKAVKTDEKTTQDDNKEEKRSMHRSPNYPSISLADAITRARTIYDRERRTPTSANVIFTHLGYPKKTGPAGRALAALRSYGLLELVNGKYRISDDAFKILMLSEDHKDRAALIRKAAFRPKLFKKLMTLYKEGLPSDATLRDHLIFEEGFNPASVDHFIRIFKATIQLASPDDEDYNDAEEGEEEDSYQEDEEDMGSEPEIQRQARKSATPPPPRTPARQHVPSAGEKVLAFNISRNSEAQVVFSGQVTQEAISKLAALLELQKDTFPTQAELDQPPPRSATWKNKDHDQPVKVIGEAGEHDGRRYVKIEGSAAGVPEDELEFDDEGAA